MEYGLTGREGKEVGDVAGADHGAGDRGDVDDVGENTFAGAVGVAAGVGGCVVAGVVEPEPDAHAGCVALDFGLYCLISCACPVPLLLAMIEQPCLEFLVETGREQVTMSVTSILILVI